MDKKEALLMPAAKPKLDSAAYKVRQPASCSASAARVLLFDVQGHPPFPCPWAGLRCGVGTGRTRSGSVLGTRTEALLPAAWEVDAAKFAPLPPPPAP